MKKKVIMSHIHSRIAKLAQGAIERGDIISCDRISDDSYIITRSSDIATTYTAVGAGSLLYLLNSLAQAQNPAESQAQ